jgi:hypothetical protein
MRGINDMKVQAKDTHNDCNYRCGDVCHLQQLPLQQQTTQ